MRRIAVGALATYGIASLLTLALDQGKPTDELSFSPAFYDRTGQLLRLGLTPDQKYRLWVPLRDLAPSLKESALLYEDRWFYWHPGVNPVALAKAVWHTYLRRDATVGASTITMQVARLRHGLETRTWRGKAEQILRALLLEWRFSKDEILEAYLNVAPYGGNIEGAGAASLVYFQKPAGSLTLGEAMLLTVLPQSPTERSPSRTASRVETSGMRVARDRLLASWRERCGGAECRDEDGLGAAVIGMERSVRRASEMPFKAPHVVDLLAKTTRTGAVRSTVDLRLQKTLERLAKQYVAAKAGIGIHNAAAMLLDWRDMTVLAHLGSVDFFDAKILGQVDGTRGKRSPGSTLKPFIYALGIDQGRVHGRTLLRDAPAAFGEWRPENFDREFAGPVSVHDALLRSRNVPAVDLAAKLKSPSLYEFLEAGGIEGLREEGFYGLALALGGAEVSMVELVRLYAMLANGGELREIHWRLGEPDGARRRLISPEAAAIVRNIMADAGRPGQGVERKWLAQPVKVAWKTGTSFSFRDAWTVGIVGPYVLAVWIGNFAGESNPAFVGVEAAAPLFFNIVDALAADGIPPTPLASTPLLKEVEVCALSGQLPGRSCRHKVLTSFVPGVSPIHVCDIHRAVSIDRVTGLRACASLPGPKREEVFEFWDSDILRLFRRAGMPRRLPPKWHPACVKSAVSASLGTAPRITSPRSSVTYNLRILGEAHASLSFSAAADSDARRLYWFVDDAFVGDAVPGRPLDWKARVGRHVVRVVDDLGRAAATAVTVEMVR